MLKVLFVSPLFLYTYSLYIKNCLGNDLYWCQVSSCVRILHFNFGMTVDVMIIH